MHIPDFTDTHPYLKRHSGLNAPSPVPAILVFTFQIPLQVRAMFGAQKVMPTINAVFYMRLREKTAEYLAIYEKGKADENRRAREASETSSVALDDKDNHEQGGCPSRRSKVTRFRFAHHEARKWRWEHIRR